ncbi:hypothetical protein IT575_10720 [bacterium]|nr:hypothetical protein [bacterium]
MCCTAASPRSPLSLLLLGLALTALLTAPAIAAEAPGNWVGPADSSYRQLNVKVFYYGCVLADQADEKGEYAVPLNGANPEAVHASLLNELSASEFGRRELMEKEAERVRRQMDDCAEFYWRNSRFNCVLNYDWQLEFRPSLRSSIAASDAPYFGPVEVEPVASARAKYDGVVQILVLYSWDKASGQLKRVRGGGGFTWGADGKKRLAPVSWWAAPPAEHACGSDWLMCHEFGHAVDSLFHVSGIREHWFNHLALSEGNIARFGEHFDCMSYILRRCKERDWADLQWGELRQWADADGDLVPDYSDELHALGLSTDPDSSKADSDSDGLSDRQEMLLGNGNREGHGERLHQSLRYCDPKNPDTDGDGLSDALDEYPALPWSGKIGMQSIPPGWLEDHPDESAVANTFTPDPLSELYIAPSLAAQAPDFAVQMGYEQDKALTILLLWPRADKMLRPGPDWADAELRLNFDFDNDGWFSGNDNYRIELSRAGITKIIRNVADGHTEGPREDPNAVRAEQLGFELPGPQGVFQQGVKLTLSRSVFPELDCKPGEEFGCNIGIRLPGQPRYQMIADPNGFVLLELR